MNTDKTYDNLRHSLVTFGEHSITMHRTPSSDTFEKLMMKITNRSAVSATDAVLKRIDAVHKLVDEDRNISESLVGKTSARIFLTCFMIISFNDDVFSVKGVIEERLINKANDVLKSFEHFRDVNGDAHRDHDLVKDFVNKFHEFTELFRTWKSQDAEKIVEVLCKAYYELEETMKVVLRGVNDNSGDGNSKVKEEREDIKIWRTEIEGQKEKIIEQIKIIGGKKGMSRLEELKKSWMESGAVDVLDEKAMLEIARKAYWDRFGEALRGDDKEMLYGLLEEIKSRLNAFTPRRDDLIKENEDAIDVELLRREIEGKAFGNEDFMKLVNFIIDRILKFETPVENEVTNKWRDNLMNKFAGKTVKYSDMLPDLLRGICERLDKIEHDYKRYIEACQRTSCGKCGANGFEAVINSFMGMPTMPRCPECNELLIDLD